MKRPNKPERKRFRKEVDLFQDTDSKILRKYMPKDDGYYSKQSFIELLKQMIPDNAEIYHSDYGTLAYDIFELETEEEFNERMREYNIELEKWKKLEINRLKQKIKDLEEK